MSESKILPYDIAAAFFDQLRKEGKRIVQCHGTFDLVHPGHVVHLEEAKALAGTAIHFAVDDMQIAEDLQMVVGHMLMKMLAAGALPSSR